MYKELEELLEYCSNEEKEAHELYNKVYDDDYDKAILHKERAEAFHDVVHRIVEIMK